MSGTKAYSTGETEVCAVGSGGGRIVIRGLASAQGLMAGWVGGPVVRDGWTKLGLGRWLSD